MEDLSIDHGHRTLATTRKGSKVLIVPPCAAHRLAIDLATGERAGGARPIVPDAAAG